MGLEEMAEMTDRKQTMPRRLSGLPKIEIMGVEVPVANRRLTRTLGLSWIDPHPEGRGLLIPCCRSVHTFGMRFPIDIHFLDAEGCIIKTEMAVGPGRVLGCRRSVAVLELQSAA